ncbi:MAG TPA: hypothetical protein EYO76_05350 [Flavobacteriaceae bacterium]|nr:hypothetical protein [Flavobacteriaceae bacterium]
MAYTSFGPRKINVTPGLRPTFADMVKYNTSDHMIHPDNGFQTISILPKADANTMNICVLTCHNNIRLRAHTGAELVTNQIVESTGDADNSRYSKVQDLSYHWLASESVKVLRIMTGQLKPTFSGVVKIWAFNTSSEDINLTIGTALAELVTKDYEYSS